MGCNTFLNTYWEVLLRCQVNCRIQFYMKQCKASEILILKWNKNKNTSVLSRWSDWATPWSVAPSQDGATWLAGQSEANKLSWRIEKRLLIGRVVIIKKNHWLFVPGLVVVLRDWTTDLSLIVEPIMLKKNLITAGLFQPFTVQFKCTWNDGVNPYITLTE